MLQPVAVLLLLVPLILLSNAQHPTLNSFTECPPSSPDEGQLFWDSHGNPLLAAQQVIKRAPRASAHYTTHALCQPFTPPIFPQMSLMMKPNSNKPQFDITPSVSPATPPAAFAFRIRKPDTPLRASSDRLRRCCSKQLPRTAIR